VARAILVSPSYFSDERSNRQTYFAINCICIAVLLCFFLGIEAVAHERLQTAAIDPLAGVESLRMKINLRYLQNTLEQLLVFIPGLLALAYYCANGYAMRAVVATTIVWILSRFVFWIGYHIAPEFRTPGLVGMAQSMIILLYVCGRFSYGIAGVGGVVAILGIFLIIEAYLFYITGRPSPS
jgi:uncharacterized MAPEG superfamily protein